MSTRDRLDALENKVQLLLNTRRAADAAQSYPIGEIVTVRGKVRTGSNPFSFEDHYSDEVQVTGVLTSVSQGESVTAYVSGVTVKDARFVA